MMLIPMRYPPAAAIAVHGVLGFIQERYRRPVSLLLPMIDQSVQSKDFDGDAVSSRRSCSANHAVVDKALPGRPPEPGSGGDPLGDRPGRSGRSGDAVIFGYPQFRVGDGIDIGSDSSGVGVSSSPRDCWSVEAVYILRAGSG